MSGADNHDDIHVLAGSYVAGLMDASETQDFEQRLANDPALRDAVNSAREQFLELDVTAAPVAPSANLWSRVEAGIDAQPQIVDLASHRQNRMSPARPAANGFWRGFAAASVVAMLAGASIYASLWPSPPRLVVVLLDDNARPVSIVETYAGQKIRVVPLGRLDVPPGRTLQVWTLPDPATGPVSIGLLSSSSATVLEGPALPNPKLEQLYEITIEPAGGSPSGRPTGPIVGKGFAKEPQV